MRRIAVAVRDGGELFLIAFVVRAAASDVYVNWPRDYVRGWKPHTSYHASGQHHHKSFGKAADVQKRQKPDAAFKGTQQIVSFGVATGEHAALNIRFDPSDFDEVFEIPIGEIGSTKYTTYLAMDLVEPSISPQLQLPDAKVLKQETYTDAEPWIVITFQAIPLPTR